MTFVKGQSGNPVGRPKETEAFKQAKRIVKNAFGEIAQLTFLAKEDEIEIFLAKKDLPIGVRCLLENVQKGNLKAIELIADRVLGKCAQQVEIGNVDNTGVTFKLVKESENRKDDQAT